MKFKFHDTFTGHWRYCFLVMRRDAPSWLDVIDFCFENFGEEGERWTNSGGAIGFKTLADATYFKLRWCDS